MCANCFARRQKTFLQYGPSQTEFQCSQCKSTFLMMNEVTRID
jgi:hypothetical protein